MRAWADSDQIVQVVLGIAINALQALEHGGRLCLRVEGRRVEGRAWAGIHVENDGPPILSGIRDRVFDPFVTSRQQGTGLGLSTAWRIVEDHHGRLEVESPPEQGQVAFRLWLPVEG